MPILRILSNGKVLLLLSVLIVCQMLVVIGVASKGILCLALILAGALVLVSFRNTFFGLCLVILSSSFILPSTKQITQPEVLWIILFFSVFTGWVIKVFVLKAEKVVRTIPELALVVFLSLCLLSILPATVQRVEVIDWFRKLFPFLIYLLYFPLVFSIRQRKQLYAVVGCFLIMGLCVGARNIIGFRSAILSIQYFFQAGSARHALSEPFFLAILVIAFSLLLRATTRLVKVLLSILTFFAMAALAVSFSRGYWIASAVSLVMLFVMASKKEKANMVIYLSVLVCLTLMIAQLFLGNIGEVVGRGLMNRAASIVQAGQDIALVQRFQEARGIFRHVKANPIVGYGLGATFSYRVLGHRAISTWYSHNAYLYLMFTLGLVGLFAYLTFYGGMLVRGCVLLRQQGYGYFGAFVRGIVCLFAGMLVVSVTSPQFIQKSSILVIVLGSAIVEILSRRDWAGRVRETTTAQGSGKQ